MARKFGNKKINQIAGKDYKFYHETFEETLHRWGAQAAQQLEDTYKYQKIFNGTSNKTYEVYGSRLVKKTRSIMTKKGPVTRTYTVKQPGWFEENERRQKRAEDTGKQNIWFSDGSSYKRVKDGKGITYENIQEHKEADLDFLIQGQITFHTTMQMLYVEAGVGANGRRKGADPRSKPIVRPADIAVNRKDEWHTRKRYTRNGWKPGKGDAVRPSTRQQVQMLRRRLKFLALEKHRFELSAWLVANLDIPDENPRAIATPMGDMTISSGTKK